MPFPLFVVRHGETDWNLEGRYQGETDIPLNETGRAQAAAYAPKLKAALAEQGLELADVDFIASSLGRARETMEIVREGIGLPREGYATHDGLKEIAVGVWSGLTFEEIFAFDGHLLADGQIGRWTGRPEGGESFEDLRARVLPVVHSLTRATVMVCHGQVSRAIRGEYLKLDPHATLALRVPQTAFYLLHQGDVTEI